MSLRRNNFWVAFDLLLMHRRGLFVVMWIFRFNLGFLIGSREELAVEFLRYIGNEAFDFV